MILIYLAISSAILIFAGLLIPLNVTLSAFESGAYYLVAAAFFLWAVVVYSAVRKNLNRGRKELFGVFISLAATLVIFIICPPRLKVLADETNLMGTSYEMFENRTPRLSTERYLASDGTEHVERIIDKRPLLYPYLVSLVHEIRGFAPENSFVVNFIASSGVLYMIFLLALRLFGFYYGIFSVLLTAFTPVFIWAATSGGFEMLNLLFWILSLGFCWRIYRSGSSKERENWICVTLFTLVLLGQCRYESTLGFFVFSVVCAKSIVRHKDAVARLSPWLAMSFLPLVWQMRLKPLLHHRDGIMDGSRFYSHKSQLFSWPNLLSNSDENVFVLLGLNADYGFSFLISMGGIAGGYLAARRIIMEKKAGLPLIFSLVSGFLLFMVISSFYWGNFTLPTNNRLSLVFLPWMVFAFLYGFHRLKSFFSFLCKPVFIVSLVVFHLFFLVRAGQKEFLLKQLEVPYLYQEVVAHLEESFPAGDRILIICRLPNLFVATGYDAVSFSTSGRILGNGLSRNGYKKVLVIQGVHGDGKISRRERLGSPYSLTPLHEIGVTPAFVYRISEVGV